MNIVFEKYKKEDEKQVIDLILDIQQNEFHVPITINQQQDLLDVENFYCKKNGNFWVAKNEKEIIGTIALIDIENNQAALRKMFLKKEWRGKEFNLGQQLFNIVLNWVHEKQIDEIYLGTRDQLIAAQKFYLRNGFIEIVKENLPKKFPIMEVDNRFYKLKIKAA